MATNYWWVNHRMTFRAESEGGYIWAPTKTKNNRTKTTWDNLKLVSKGDLIFSFANAEICAIGTVTETSVLARRPKYRAKGAAAWSDRGNLVKVAWVPLEKRLSPREHIEKIKGLLPIKNSPIQAENGHGNQSCYLASISGDLAKTLIELIGEENTGAVEILQEKLTASIDERIAADIRTSNLPETEKMQLVLARIGQGQFRRDVIKSHGSVCRVTGVKGMWLVTASHIKPWRDSDNKERLDDQNGLLLAPHVDRLFDQGYISFNEEGKIIAAGPEINQVLVAWGIDPVMKISPMPPRQRSYMEYHRTHIFRGQSVTTQ